MLMLVTDRDESLRAFEAFESAFTAGAALFPNHYVGFHGGHEITNVHWHGSAGIWGLFVRQARDQDRKPLGRFWNCFGVDDPRKHSSLNITVEMNPPHEGENRRTAGVFLRDEAGRFYVGHTGEVGGGRPGIGQRRFRDFGCHLPWQVSRRRVASGRSSSSARFKSGNCSVRFPGTSARWLSSRTRSPPA